MQTALFGWLRKGALLGLTHPTTWWFQAPVWWNFGVLALVWLLLPHGRLVTLSLFCAQLGVSFYVYMPIVSDLRNPPMNWGYPRTWEGFKHAITRGQYEKIVPSIAQLNRQLGSYFTDLRVQFTLLLAPLGFLPFAAWQMRGPAWPPKRGGRSAWPRWPRRRCSGSSACARGCRRRSGCCRSAVSCAWPP